MGDIINLRRARKARQRAADRTAATARAARHGESAPVIRARRAAEALADRRLDGAHLTAAEPGEPHDSDG